MISAETKLKEIGERYGVDFGAEGGEDLQEFLKKKGYHSLASMLKKDTDAYYSDDSDLEEDEIDLSFLED